MEESDDLRPPCSRKQPSRLGARLIEPSPSDADWALYGEVIDFFDASMGRLRDQIGAIDWVRHLGREVSISVTGRAKTRGTLLDKLRRTPAIGMGYVRDIAGVRIVGDFTLREQDAVVSHLLETLDPNAKVIDRRADPQSGYRAVHVVVTNCGALAEIQVRTDLQALWAEIYERLADILGRGIRYGESPDDDGLKVSELIAALQGVSINHIARTEDLQQQFADLVKKSKVLVDVLPGHLSVKQTLEKARVAQEEFESTKRGVRETLRDVLAALEGVAPEAT